MHTFWHTSASAEILPTSTAAQRQASVDGQYPFLPAAVYSDPSWTKELLQCERNKSCYELYRLPTERVVDSKIENENQRLLSTCITCIAQLTTLEGHFSVRPSASVATDKVASRIRPWTRKNFADTDAFVDASASAHLWSFIYPLHL